MAYDEVLAARIRSTLGARHDVSEQKMFGGIAFLIGGRMAVGVTGDELMVRVGTDGHEAALARPHARPMDFTGRPMHGFISVAPEGVREDHDLARWVEEGAAFAATQPSKPGR